MPDSAPRSSARRSWLLAALVGGVYAVHQDVWNWSSVEPLVLGFLPTGLAYHAGYSFLAAGTMWLLVRYAWPKHLEEGASTDPGRRDKSP